MNYDTLVTGVYGVNTYILHDGKSAAIVDPGADADKIFDYLTANELDATAIIITHAHFDHVGAVGELQKRLPTVRTYMSAVDFDVLARDGFVSHCGYDIPVEPFAVDNKLTEGDEFNLFGHNFVVMSTPGHTVGSVCYIVDDETILSGDTLFKHGIGRSDFAYGDGKALSASLAKLFGLRKNYKILPGHGEPTTLDCERKYANRY